MLRPGATAEDAHDWDEYHDEPRAECDECGGLERPSQNGTIISDPNGRPIHVGCYAERLAEGRG
jgi:hypothetical protein